ncbi:MAG TPA: MerR family transcriptional regulator [Gaiellaceae bacterium]|nr:MerR family transcriptional regulator [Gaiellaceae bacterium]
MRTVREVAELAGVTVRALHHYDEIGLLKPSGRSESGYRLYSHEDLLRLHEIVAWRQLGFSLREVQELVDEPDHDRAAALRRQRTLARDRLARAAALVDALDGALAAHDNRQRLKEETMFQGLSSMTPLVLVDARGEELGRCSVESRVVFERAQSVDLGPVGYFRILDVRAGDPIVLVAEPAERKQWPYELVVREDGVEQRRAFMDECSWSVGDQVKWPPERGEDPVAHEVVALRPAVGNRGSVIIIERVA